MESIKYELALMSTGDNPRRGRHIGIRGERAAGELVARQEEPSTESQDQIS